MRGLLVGLGVFALLVLGGFGALVFLAESAEPQREEVRVEIEDDFPR